MDEILLFGDSITNGRIGIDYQRYLKTKTRSFGQDGASFSSVFDRSIRYLGKKGAQLVVIQGGANDLLIPHMRSISREWDKVASVLYNKEPLSHDNLDLTLSKIENCFRNYTFNIPLLVCSIVPLGEELSSDLNKKRESLNSELKNIIKTYDNIFYCDITTDLVKIIQEGNNFSPFLIPNPRILEEDALFIAGDEKRSLIRSSERMLKTTVDGIHPNSVGAQAIAHSLESCFMNSSRVRELLVH